MIIESKLKSGVIFGANENGEYVYMPGSEIGAVQPLCVFESSHGRDDVDLQEALRLIRVLSLRPSCHPLLGWSSC